MKNVRLTYILTFLSECYWPSVAALFFYLRIFSFTEIATLWAIQMAATTLFEIPTGAFADIAGRKTSIILSFVIGAVSLFLFPFTTVFWVFAVLEILKGLANALYSGSVEALVYDSLKEEKNSYYYPRASATIETVTWASWAISSVVGGYLYYWHYQSPWLIQGTMYLAAAAVAWRLIEPKLDSITVDVRSALRQNLEGFRELFRSPRIGRITLQLAVIGAGYIIASNLLGPSQAREYGLDARGTGWLFGIGCLFSVTASRFFPALRHNLGEKNLILVTTAMLLVSFLAARHVGLMAGSALILLRIASSSTFRNTRSVIVNTWISSKNRATGLSTLNLLTQSPYILLAPLFGLQIDRSSPNIFAFYLGIGTIFLLGLLYILPRLRPSSLFRS